MVWRWAVKMNDHDVLRSDRVLALLVGKADVEGASRVRARDRGRPLAGSSTLNRLELSTAEDAASDRYKRIVADTLAMDACDVHVQSTITVDRLKRADKAELVTDAG
jgi:hypothetical protein